MIIYLFIFIFIVVCREFMQRLTTDQAAASNPDCDLKVEVTSDMNSRPVIKAVYGNFIIISYDYYSLL